MYGTCYFVRFPIIRAQYENTPDSRHQPVEHRFHSTLRRPLSICEAIYGCARPSQGHYVSPHSPDMVVNAAPIHHLTRAVCVEPLKNEERGGPVQQQCLRPRSSQHSLPMAASAPTPECRRGRHVAVTGSRRSTITARPRGEIVLSIPRVGVIHRGR